MAMTDYVSRL